VWQIRRVPATRLLLVRHGESTWNRRGVVQGRTAHVPLTDTGHQQAARAARVVAEHRPTRLWTSDQARARETADHIAAALGLAPQPDPRLRERSYGRDEGRPVGQVAAHGRPEVTPDGGESWGELLARVGSFLEELEQLEEAGTSTVVAVTHGDTLRAALTWLGTTWHEPLTNGCVIGPLPVVRGRVAADLPAI
jgi:broad specificity phosphatase PhoE